MPNAIFIGGYMHGTCRAYDYEPPKTLVCPKYAPIVLSGVETETTNYETVEYHRHRFTCDNGDSELYLYSPHQRSSEALEHLIAIAASTPITVKESA